MQLPKESIKEFQEVLKKEYGKKEISFEEASILLEALCRLTGPVYGKSIN